MKSGFDYDKVHQLNCSKPGLYLTTYRNLNFTLKEPNYRALEKARQVRLAEDIRLTKKAIEKKLTELEVLREILYENQKAVENLKKEN